MAANRITKIRIGCFTGILALFLTASDAIACSLDFVTGQGLPIQAQTDDFLGPAVFEAFPENIAGVFSCQGLTHEYQDAHDRWRLSWAYYLPHCLLIPKTERYDRDGCGQQIFQGYKAYNLPFPLSVGFIGVMGLVGYRKHKKHPLSGKEYPSDHS